MSSWDTLSPSPAAGPAAPPLPCLTHTDEELSHNDGAIWKIKFSLKNWGQRRCAPGTPQRRERRLPEAFASSGSPPASQQQDRHKPSGQQPPELDPRGSAGPGPQHPVGNAPTLLGSKLSAREAGPPPSPPDPGSSPVPQVVEERHTALTDVLAPVWPHPHEGHWRARGPGPQRPQRWNAAGRCKRGVHEQRPARPSARAPALPGPAGLLLAGGREGCASAHPHARVLGGPPEPPSPARPQPPQLKRAGITPHSVPRTSGGEETQVPTFLGKTSLSGDLGLILTVPKLCLCGPRWMEKSPEGITFPTL